jgi:hypothetical protein
MAVATRRFERKDKAATYFQGWYQRVAGGTSVLVIALAAVHFLNRLGIDSVRGWDLIGWILGYAA